MDREKMMKKEMMNLGSLEGIALGHGQCFVVKGEEIAVFRLRSGRLVAVNNRCPHRQGPLVDGLVGDTQIVCPLHGHKFDLITGKGNEAGECIKIYKVWEENGQLILEQVSKT
jgi:nitrite reductase (NADH) small subunit